ncbi:WD40 repeat-containing protein HOS15 [Bienertia sinuspersici]
MVKEKQTKEKVEEYKARAPKDKEEAKRKEKEKPQHNQVDLKLEDKYAIQNETPEGAEPMDISMDTASLPLEIPSSDVKVLEGHCSEVVYCAFVLLKLLYSRSGDSTARLWAISDGPSTSSVHNRLLNVVVLKHLKGQTNEESKDVTTLDWNLQFRITGNHIEFSRFQRDKGSLKVLCTAVLWVMVEVLERQRSVVEAIKSIV